MNCLLESKHKTLKISWALSILKGVIGIEVKSWTTTTQGRDIEQNILSADAGGTGNES